MDPRSVGDIRFYARSGPFSLAEIAATANGTAAASDRMFTGIARCTSPDLTR